MISRNVSRVTPLVVIFIVSCSNSSDNRDTAGGGMGPAGAAGDREGGKGGAAGAGSSAGAAGKDGGSGGPRREARTRPEVLMVAPTLRAEPQAKQPPERAALARAPEPIQRVPRASAAIAARLHHGRMRVFARRHAKAARPAAGSRAFATFAQSRRSAPRGNDGSSRGREY